MTLVNRLFSFKADSGIFFLYLYIIVIAHGQLQRVFIARLLPKDNNTGKTEDSHQHQSTWDDSIY